MRDIEYIFQHSNITQRGSFIIAKVIKDEQIQYFILPSITSHEEDSESQWWKSIFLLAMSHSRCINMPQCHAEIIDGVECSHYHDTSLELIDCAASGGPSGNPGRRTILFHPATKLKQLYPHTARKNL